jgi:CubicO group peptidase (beta-lactamase class C family)
MSNPDRFRPSRRTLIKASAASAALAIANAMAPRPAGAWQNGAAPTATPATGADLDRGLADMDRDFADLDALVAERMAALGVPGVAVGILLGDREHAAGFGVTNVDHPLPVDEATLFQIGSTTKTYTGTALMRLVEAGDIDLDAPVREYLPEFRVADEEVSAAVTVRHLVNHTGGWFGDDFTDPGDGDEALARYVEAMADLPQIAPLGEHFSYNNAAVIAAGRVVEAVTGQTYEAALKELVLDPLGMDRSFFFAEEILTEAVAAGHDGPPEAPVVVGPWAIPRAANPAGGIVSDIRDVLRYARLHLGDGTANGERVLSPASLELMRTRQGPGGALGAEVLDGAGITWLLSTIDGVQVVQHGGSTNGQQSALALVPERNFAVAVHTNANAGAVLGAEVVAWALDRFLNLHHPAPTEEPLPGALASAIVGSYGDPAANSIAVAEQDNGLVATPLQAGEPLPGEELTLRFVGDDRFVSDYDGIAVYTDAVRDGDGAVAWLRFSGRLYPLVR